MKIYDQLVTYLQQQPLARERKNKDRAVCNLLVKKHTGLKQALDAGLISKEVLVAFVQDYNSYDRQWRKVVAENEELRGSDYGDKEVLEQETMLGLGYQPGFSSLVKSV